MWPAALARRQRSRAASTAAASLPSNRSAQRAIGRQVAGLGAVDQHQHRRRVRVVVAVGQPDRLAGGVAVARRAVRQEARLVIGPQHRVQMLDPLRRGGAHDDRDSLARGRVPAGAAGRARAASSAGGRSRSRPPPHPCRITPSRNTRRRSGRAAGRRRRSRPSARSAHPFSTRRRRRCRDAPRARR